MGRHGLIKNWKKRYITLIDGQLSYYVSAGKAPIYGDDLKGGLHLANTEITSSGVKNSKQIHIYSFNGDKNILLEAETEEGVNAWVEIIQNHIDYADNFSASAADTVSANEVLADVRRATADDSYRGSSFSSNLTSFTEHGDDEDEDEEVEDDIHNDSDDDDNRDGIYGNQTRIEAFTEYVMGALSTVNIFN
jgi:hypothetical protein